MSEGWQSWLTPGNRVYHYIVDSFSLCRKLGFYHSDLDPDNGKPNRGPEDCSACWKKLLRRREEKKP